MIVAPHALNDGEDFELILAVPADAARELIDQQPLDVPLARIGTFVSEPGLRAEDEDGQVRSIEPRGYEHRLDP